MDELKQALGVLALAESELASASAKVKAATERAVAIARRLNLPPGRPFSADRGASVFGVTDKGQLFRTAVEHV